MNNLLIELLLILAGLLFTIFLFRYLFSSDISQDKVFLAVDGTKFDNQRSCNEYDLLYKRLICLYQEDALLKSKNKKEILGLNLLFVKQLKNEGFSDIKTLINYKDDFHKLTELLNSDVLLEEELSK